MEKTKQEERNLEAFKAGVIEGLKAAGLEEDEYTSLFWGNVYGNEFSDEDDAHCNGIEVVEASLID